MNFINILYLYVTLKIHLDSYNNMQMRFLYIFHNLNFSNFITIQGDPLKFPNIEIIKTIKDR